MIRLITFLGCGLAIAGCDSRVVRDRTITQDGVRVTLEDYSRSPTSLRMRVIIKNVSGDDIALRTRPGKTFWASLDGAVPAYTVTAVQWSNRPAADRFSGVWSQTDVRGDEIIHAPDAEELELRFTFKDAAPSGGAWRLMLSVTTAKGGSLELAIPGEP